MTKRKPTIIITEFLRKKYCESQGPDYKNNKRK